MGMAIVVAAVLETIMAVAMLVLPVYRVIPLPQRRPMAGGKDEMQRFCRRPICILTKLHTSEHIAIKARTYKYI